MRDSWNGGFVFSAILLPKSTARWGEGHLPTVSAAERGVALVATWGIFRIMNTAAQWEPWNSS